MKQQTLITLKDVIEKRRACSSFRPDPIPEEILQEILTLGLRAPSSYNLQPWRFIVVKDQENKQKLKSCAFNQRSIAEAPVVLICCGDRRVSQKEYIESVIKIGFDAEAMNDTYANVMRKQIPPFFEYHPCFESVEAWTNRQTMLAVAQMMITAKSLGIDSGPIEGFITAQVKKAFNIPAEVDVCCLLTLGYAAEPFKKYGGRFGIDQVCYRETYGEGFQINTP